MNISTIDTEEVIFLDANILLEVILDREHKKSVIAYLESHNTTFNISALTAHLIIYFGSKIVDLPILRDLFKDFSILPLEGSDFEWAFVNSMDKDFEDALQLSVAIRNGCSRFVTLDRSLAKSYDHLPQINIELLIDS